MIVMVEVVIINNNLDYKKNPDIGKLKMIYFKTRNRHRSNYVKNKKN